MIEINKYAYSPRTLENVLAKMLMRRARGVNLDTSEGCLLTAQIITNWLVSVGPENHPGGHG